MRFMIIRKADPQTEASAMPSRELVEAMMAYNEEMIRAGVMLGGDGLKPSSHGARIKFSKGKPKVTDGPFSCPGSPNDPTPSAPPSAPRSPRHRRSASCGASSA